MNVYSNLESLCRDIYFNGVPKADILTDVMNRFDRMDRISRTCRNLEALPQKSLFTIYHGSRRDEYDDLVYDALDTGSSWAEISSAFAKMISHFDEVMNVERGDDDREEFIW